MLVSVVSESCDPRDCSPPGSSVHGILQAKMLEWSGLPCPPPGHLPDPGMEPAPPAWVGGFFSTEPPGKPVCESMLTGLVVSDSLQVYGLYPVRLLCPWDSPGKNTGVDCHALLQRIFPTQGLSPYLLCLLH